MVDFDWQSLGKVLIDLRDDADVAAIVGANPTSTPPRVRGGEPQAAVPGGYDGDVHGPGEYRAFVVIVDEGFTRDRRTGIQRPRHVARCYARNRQEARALASAVSNAMHDRGPRVHANGLGIYRSFNDSGGEADFDPDTKQPFVPLFIDLIATTQAVA